jgi:uncharacterized protein YggT (Ycf19 family)
MINENNILKTFRQHTILAIGIIGISAIISLLVVTNKMKKYKNACQSTFIYYKNGSSVLVSNLEK